MTKMILYCSKERGRDMYQFTDDCLIGVEQIDNEHRRLFELVNDTAELLEKVDVNRSDVTELFRELNDYAVLHFAHEEQYMEEINDPELPKQREMHKAFVTKLKEIELGDIKSEDDKESINNILKFVARWLFSHILSSDTMIGVFQKMDQKLEEEKNPFAFTDEYRTGIAFVDEEHMELFRIIKRANDLITEELLHDKYDEIMSVLEELRDYTKKHFGDEEEYMEKIQYEALDVQKKAHQVFVDKLQNINTEDMDDNQQQYLIDIVDFLLMWLVNHILKMDKKIPNK